MNIVGEVPSDYIIYCPFHNNHRTPAGEVSKETGIFFCFGCGKTCDLSDLVMHVTGKTYFQAMRVIGSHKSNLDDVVKKMDAVKEVVVFPQREIDRLHAALDDRAVSYLHGRGITALDEFEIGYSLLRDMVTVPLHNPVGVPVGFVGRSIEGKDFKNSKDLPRKENLFNLHRVKTSSYVYLLESSFDVIRCHQLGIPAVSSLGSNVSKDQIELLFKYFPEVYVVPDRDNAGRKMALTLMHNGATLVAVPEGYNDVGNLSDEGIKTLLDRSNPIAGLL